jgi:hypothetical protein
MITSIKLLIFYDLKKKYHNTSDGGGTLKQGAYFQVEMRTPALGELRNLAWRTAMRLDLNTQIQMSKIRSILETIFIISHNFSISESVVFLLLL